MGNKPSIFITRKLPEEILEPYQHLFHITMWHDEYKPIPRNELLQKIKDVDGLLCMLSDQIDQKLFEHAQNLKIVANLAVGYDNIQLDAAKNHGVIVTNTPDVLTETTADLTFALLMATGRRIVEANEFIKNDEWSDWSPFLLAGKDIFKQTIGIVGMGRIGEAVARRAKGFDMPIIYHNRTRNKRAEKDLNATYVSFEDLLQKSDYVVSLVPLTDQTEEIFNRKAFQLMKKSAIFINVSRGQTVDEEALYEALKSKEILGAGLDVFIEEPISANHPFMSLDNVVCLPHIGSASVKTRKEMIKLCLNNFKQYFAGKEVLTPVTS